ncbi:MAG: serine hydrolase [Acidobacteria bacterium]|nr:serine hydrolase [Acidobacteriota bacterium]
MRIALARRLLPVALLAAGCATKSPVLAPADPPLDAILASDAALRADLETATDRRIQVVLGWIEPGDAGRPVLRQAGFRSGAEYSYPASSVKLFAAIAALERLETLRAETGLDLTLDTPLVYHPLFEGETLEADDPTHLAGGKITLRHEIRKLFLVSDNESFNKLYELVGPDGLAASLARAGLGDVRIVHRLSEARTPEENLRSPRIELVGDAFRYEIPERVAAAQPPPLPIPRLEVGTAYLAGDETIAGPMDFSAKNRFPIADLQRGLCKLARPDVDCGPGGSFELTDAHRAFLLETMSELPAQSTDPVFDATEYPDAWGKHLLPGLERVVPRARFRIHNKTGGAYGFSTENSWVVDTATGRSFFLAATIYTNRDGVLNDDRYEYDTEAYPFLERLGEAAGLWFWAEEADQAKKR